jgi:hypothetical protein
MWLDGAGSAVKTRMAQRRTDTVNYMSSCEAVPLYAPLHLFVSLEALLGTVEMVRGALGKAPEGNTRCRILKQ